MPDMVLKIRQFRHESDTWKRNLDFIIQENNNLKNRLSEVLQSTEVDKEMLDRSEYYNEEFTRGDIALSLLKRDIANMDKVLENETNNSGHAISHIMRRHKKLSLEIGNAIAVFNKLKFEFNNYLGEVL